jgi:hypothetical protein
MIVHQLNRQVKVHSVSGNSAGLGAKRGNVSLMARNVHSVGEDYLLSQSTPVNLEEIIRGASIQALRRR